MTPPTTDQRLRDLKIKASNQKELLDQLEQVAVRQQRKTDLLRLALAH